MAAWRMAKSLEKLREQLNTLYPTRSKVSDGGIGDAAHASRSSDHNPHVKDGGMGVVTARDFTNDPKTLKGQWLADALADSRDPRIKYIIFNHEMCRSYPANGKPAWTWQPYNGINAHEHHVHVSVSADKALYDSTREWALPPLGVAADIQQPELTSSPSPVVPPLPEEQTVTVKDGEVKVETSGPASAPERVAVEKPAPLGFASSMKTKISTVLGGNVTLQVIRDYAEQAKAIGLSPRFWMWISVFAVVGGLVWLGVEVYRHWSANRRELEITKELVTANTSPTNTVQLIDSADLLKYEQAGYKVVRR